MEKGWSQNRGYIPSFWEEAMSAVFRNDMLPASCARVMPTDTRLSTPAWKKQQSSLELSLEPAERRSEMKSFQWPTATLPKTLRFPEQGDSRTMRRCVS